MGSLSHGLIDLCGFGSRDFLFRYSVLHLHVLRLVELYEIASLSSQ